MSSFICELKPVLLTLTILHHYCKDKVVCVDLCKYFEGYEFHAVECIEIKVHISSVRYDDLAFEMSKKAISFIA